MPIAAKAMRLDHIAEVAFQRLLGRLIWQALIVFVFVVCVVVALYHYTIAGMLMLEIHYGPLLAQVITGTIYAALSIVILGGLWVHKRTNSALSDKTATAPRELQLLMLMEAAILGYEVARKRTRIGQPNG